ncbi:hypothetical protein SAMN04487926_1352 [Paraburkholderia steynii]|uniref:Uncharacterized protein n=1 Tax=Paraburkholderia steynii TaxID=1245441 RepID=A0A7Z7BFX8_9BURK|nr:hypothetical protein [Paraburkholderia steynii]SDJ14636.1 hypothetical protein SAMN04487926_1352 [Paraburkholderia steynii]
MALDYVINRLAERYGNAPMSGVAKRNRRSALDDHLGLMGRFTLRRLDSPNPREFSLRKLAEEIERNAGHRFTADAVRSALIKHNLYQLWR